MTKEVTPYGAPLSKADLSLEISVGDDAGAEARHLFGRERRREERRALRIGAKQVDDVMHALAEVAPVGRRARGAARRTRIVLLDERIQERMRGLKPPRNGR